MERQGPKEGEVKEVEKEGKNTNDRGSKDGKNEEEESVGTWAEVVSIIILLTFRDSIP